jgi:beta-glucanase (GH16 family)
MRAIFCRLVILTPLVVNAACGGADDEPIDWQLVWSDEFDGAAGSGPDPARWSFETGGHGWGNQELQLYSDRPENASLDGAGHLVITARREAMGGREYTSARIITRGKFEQVYGRFEARLRLPAGKGFWPAFWMLGNDVGVDGVRWPACGEIDVVEQRGAHPWRISGAAHGPGHSGGNALIGAFETPGRTALTGDFHLYAMEWEPHELRFYVDGQRYHSVRSTRMPSGAIWVYDHPFFLLLNLAVGGNFGGAPDQTTPFPQTLGADYVRVYVRR